MNPNENTLNEIEQERTSYLINLDDMNYEMLAEPLVIRNKYIDVLGEINLVNGLIYTEEKEFTEILDIQSQIEFPKREFQHVCSATLEAELAENPSY